MKYKKLNSICLHTITKESTKEIEFYKELLKDEIISYRLHGLGGILLPPDKFPFLGRSFLVSFNDDLFGYVHIGEFNPHEEAVYLKAAIHRDKRGTGYGKLLLEEITNYIFVNYQEVKCIKLKIAKDNLASIHTANSCGYIWLTDDFYIKYNPYLEEQLKKPKF